MQGPWEHHTVLLNEAIEALQLRPEGSYIDATFGRGGHSRLILSALSPQGRLLTFDKDPQAVAEGQRLAAQDTRFSIRHAGFAQLSDMPAASCDGLLMDLGVSSPQIDDPSRGFSFRRDGPLDMRMDSSSGLTVAQWLAQAPVQEITEVIRDYGEERFAGPIAKAIDRHRSQHGPLASTAELAQVVAGAVKTREPGKDPATRTFQAFRIFINAELEELRQALEASLHVLKPQGLLVVISFHSLEDRIVKQFMAGHARQVYDRRAPMAAPQPMKLELGPRLMPSAAEIAANPRARSAVMRVAQRTEAA
jgi:16S rRNA (cytosine1402-N4)-methyltransferase